MRYHIGRALTQITAQLGNPQNIISDRPSQTGACPRHVEADDVNPFRDFISVPAILRLEGDERDGMTGGRPPIAQNGSNSLGPTRAEGGYDKGKPHRSTMGLAAPRKQSDRRIMRLCAVQSVYPETYEVSQQCHQEPHWQ